MQTYYPRLADRQLEKRLQYAGAVLIEGPKWCGKTSTAEQHARSSVYMQDPDNRAGYLKLADTKPSVLLEGEAPRLIDEWQTAPVLWDAVRFQADRRQKPGQFILTGSAVPAENDMLHSGTGRVSRLLMRPMSLYESRESSGAISLLDLFNGVDGVSCLSPMKLEDIASAIVRGGWPASIGMPEAYATGQTADYIQAVIYTDISRIDGIVRNPHRVQRLLHSLARNVSTLASLKTLQKDTASGELGIEVSTKTIAQYMEALRRIFVIEEVPAWDPSLRSKTAVRSAPKRQFVDPSLAAAVLRLTSARLFQDFEYFGFLFESLCTRDLRIYAEANDGHVFYYRDSTGLEADLIVALNDGRWGAVEVKTGTKEIEKAAENLNRLKSKVDLEKMGSPSFLMILTGSAAAYTREDGIHVVPIGILKP